MLNKQMLDELKKLISEAKSDEFKLENNADTWQKIGEGSIIDELYKNGVSDPENYLKTWIYENEYLS